MEKLSQEMISEILTRLPAKSIHRFKCVSKTWHSLISSPQFISSFLSISPPSWTILDQIIRVDPGLTHNHNLTFSGPPNVSFLSITPLISNPPKSKGGNFPVVINGGDGLLLLAVKDSKCCAQDNLFISNPITRKWYQLPNPPRLLNQHGAIGLATRVVGPNGPVVNFVVAEYGPVLGSEYASLMTFSSETGKWVVKTADYKLGLHMWRSDGSFTFDGVMYWVDLSFGLVAWDEPFSREDEVRCRFLSLPRKCRRSFCIPGLDKSRCIGVSGGFIQFMDVVKDGGFLNLWRFKEEKWSLVYKANLVDVWNDKSLVPRCLFFHPFEVDVGFFGSGDSVYGVNVREKKVVSTSSYSNLARRMFFMPFVIPSWPTSLPPAIIGEKDNDDKYSKKKRSNKVETNTSRRKSSRRKSTLKLEPQHES